MTVPTFYGREWELEVLNKWVVEERCRVVNVLGLGGIGKSALAVKVMHRVAANFEVVIWRSVRDVPSCEGLLNECLQVLSPHSQGVGAGGNERRLTLLLDNLRTQRVLLVLDNLETLLEEGKGTGAMRAGYEDYGRLLQRISETEHQSCLLLTSREKPAELVSLEGNLSPVRGLRLSGLGTEACEKLLAEKDVKGNGSVMDWLAAYYTAGKLGSLPKNAPVWVSLSPRNKGEALGIQTVADICEKRLGISKVHTLRHTFARAMEDAGAKISTIQSRLGHSSLATTGQYLVALHQAENEHAVQIAEMFGLED